MEKKSARSLLWKKPISEEVQEELQFHLDMRVEQYVEEGLEETVALEKAKAAFGDLDHLARRCRALARQRDRRLGWSDYLADLRLDLGYALRHLGRRPGFTLAAVLTLALGLGAVIAAYGLVHAVLLEALPLPQGDRLMVLQVQKQDGSGRSQIVAPNEYAAWREVGEAFDGVAAILPSGISARLGDLPERVDSLYVSDAFFAVAQAPMRQGRAFAPDDFGWVAEKVVILSHSFWRRSLAAEPGILGKSLQLEGQEHQVVGILGPELEALYPDLDVLLPLTLGPEQLQIKASYLLALGRLAPGASRPAATAALAGAQGSLNAQRAEEDRRDVVLTPVRSFLAGDLERRLLLLLGAVSLVLLIACVNVANLLLAQGLGRRRELSVRSSLGAGRGRILRQLLTENLLLSGAACLLGLLLAGVLIRGVLRFIPEEVPGLESASISPPVLLFACALAVGAMLLAGLVPALRSSRRLEGVMAGRAWSWRRDRFRQALVAAQVCLTLVLLVASGLLIQSSINEGKVDPGFFQDGVLTALVSLPQQDYPDRESVVSTFERLVETSAAVPGVASAAAGSRAPLAGPSLGMRYFRPENPEQKVDGGFRMASAGYFASAGIRMLRGRGFLRSDRAGAPSVAVVNEAFAREIWGEADPLGQRITTSNYSFTGGTEQLPEITIVGVVANVKDYGLRSAVRPELYMSLDQSPGDPWSWVGRSVVLILETEIEPELVVSGLRTAVASVDPGLPVFNVETMRSRLRESAAPGRFNTLLFVTLGVVALLLATAGIYSLTAFFVAQQQYEIGVRLALGATRRRVLREVVLRALAPVLVGLGAGLLVAAYATALLRGELFGVEAFDPRTFALTAILVLLVAYLASLLPARRTTAIDPARVLQAE